MGEQMIGLIKEYFGDYLRFWQFLGVAMLRPVEEISYRARSDSGFHNSVMFLGASIATSAALLALVAGQNLTDLTRLVIMGINAAVLSLLGCLCFVLAWKAVRYEGNVRLLMRMGFYFNAIYMVIWTIPAILFYGAFKLLSPLLYQDYNAALLDCSGGVMAKGQRLTDILSTAPLIDTLSMVHGGIILAGLLFYWIASIRLYFQLFPMGRLRGGFAFLLASLLWCILSPLGWIFFLAIGQTINGC